MSKADPKIYLEARIVLYGKNEWRLNGILPENDMFRSYPQLFRRVTFVFNTGNISPALKHHFWKMHAKRDYYSDEFRATHEQCLREVLRAPQWPQLFRAFIPYLDIVALDMRGIKCSGFRDRAGMCEQGGMFYNNYLACLKLKAESDQGTVQKRPRVGFWGTNWERDIIQSLIRPDVPPESVKQLTEG